MNNITDDILIENSHQSIIKINIRNFTEKFSSHILNESIVFYSLQCLHPAISNYYNINSSFKHDIIDSKNYNPYQTLCSEIQILNAYLIFNHNNLDYFNNNFFIDIIHSFFNYIIKNNIIITKDIETITPNWINYYHINKDILINKNIKPRELLKI